MSEPRAVDCFAGVEPPSAFLGRLESLRSRNKYAKNWKLCIKRKKNRHTDCDGSSWGWYEVWPLDVTLGYWARNRDDLRHCDIEEWNRQAALLS